MRQDEKAGADGAGRVVQAADCPRTVQRWRGTSMTRRVATASTARAMETYSMTIMLDSLVGRCGVAVLGGHEAAASGVQAGRERTHRREQHAELVAQSMVLRTVELGGHVTYPFDLLDVAVQYRGLQAISKL